MGSSRGEDVLQKKLDQMYSESDFLKIKYDALRELCWAVIDEVSVNDITADSPELENLISLIEEELTT